MRSSDRASGTVLAVSIALIAPLALAGTASAAPPANDNFADGIVIPPAGTSAQPGTTAEATGESGEPATPPSGTANTVWYAWTPDVDVRVTIHTCESTSDTVLSVHTGNAVNVLALVADNDDASGFCAPSSPAGSRVVFDASGGTAYRIRIDGFGSTTGPFELSVRPHLPTIFIDPPAEEHAFGSQVVGTLGPSRVLGLINGTNASVTVTTVHVDVGDFIVTADSCSGAVLAPDGRCAVRIRFAPEAPGTRSGFLTWRTTAVSPASVRTSLTGIGTLPAQVPAGPQGIPGEPGPAGPQGPPGAGLAGAKVKCKVRPRGDTFKVKCKLVLPRASANRELRAKLTRGGEVYARSERVVHRERVRLVLLPTQTIDPGRYRVTIREPGAGSLRLALQIGAR